MSIKNKIIEIKNKAISEFEKKERDILEIKKDIENLIDIATKEIRYQKKELDDKERSIDRKLLYLDNKEKRLQDEFERKERSIDRKEDAAIGRIDSHIDDVIDYFEDLESYGKPPLIIDSYINACFILDGKLSAYFHEKQRPSHSSAEILKSYRKEIKSYLIRIKDLEYQLSELWGKDIDTSEKDSFDLLDDDEERVRYFLDRDEYYNLSNQERNQHALDSYLSRKHSRQHIGKMYERFIGYKYEIDGYDVTYRGIELGLKDGGIDLVCKKDNDVLFVQCKNWSQESTIYEKHICQLYGASKYYGDIMYLQKGNVQFDLFSSTEFPNIKPVFITTTNLDDNAQKIAHKLGVEFKYIKYERYPIIKCNISSSGEKIYHLPFDQMYDIAKIKNKGECYVSTVKEAEEKGFRRAKRHYF